MNIIQEDQTWYHLSRCWLFPPFRVLWTWTINSVIHINVTEKYPKIPTLAVPGFFFLERPGVFIDVASFSVQGWYHVWTQEKTRTRNSKVIDPATRYYEQAMNKVHNRFINWGSFDRINQPSCDVVTNRATCLQFKLGRYRSTKARLKTILSAK